MYWIFGVFFAFLVFLTTQVVAEDQCEEVEARIITVLGDVEIQRRSTMQWLQAKPDDVLCRNDLLRSGANSKADILILEETRMALDERTSIRISASSNKTKTVFSNLIDLFAGEAYFRSRKARELNIETPIFNAMHEGTEFLVKVSGDQAQVIVFDGVVLASNKQGQVRVKQGQSAQASKGQAPVIGPRIELRDAVQWTLYYPPVIDYSEAGQLFANSALQPILGHILNNDLTQAFEQLNVLPVTEQTADYYVLYASLLLTVGQVDEALKHLNQIKQNSPRQAEALSLRSMIALAQNDQPKALQLAQHAEQINNTSPSPHIALSYVYQAQFDIDKALKSAQQAAQAGPKNGLAWARVSELELATGNVDDSMQAADQAQRLNPRLSKTNTVLGFARLASLELSEAEQSFREAIARDPSDPLARLGLGLAKIRQGHIKSGTRDMETAANLDPGNALIRSYLGKAYYEQRRGTIANTEYQIAKHLDPNDPTPWFYDAIYKQTVNRPVEALHDMQKAIELNDNRAVFRSKLLLDEDLASRSAALGRIYNDLGFQQRGLLEGWKAVNADPGNYSAHRLLADNYAALPRHEIARVSELLQSQLLQPVNITPIQAGLSESNLLILDGLGPSNSSFNEFNPLFARNRNNLQLSGTYGNNNSFGNEFVFSGLMNKFSYSFSQLHFETDGFRNNNNLNQNIYTAFIQYRINQNFDIQFEYNFKDIGNGDLRYNLDLDDF
nr:FecR domain-containing protein [Gammaproteobacteria bacterium]